MFLLQKTSIFILLLIATAVLMFLSAILGVILDNFVEARIFFYYGLLILLISLFLTFASFKRALSSPIRSQILVAISSFIFFPLIFTLPLLSLLPELDNHTLYFEMVSAFTTTGLTGLYTIDGISDTILFWQGLVAWFGGLLIWTFYFSIFATLDINDIFMMGGNRRKIEKKSYETKKIHHTEVFLNTFGSIFLPYIILTMILWGVLRTTGDNTFIALIYAMSTMSTSGISPYGSELNSTNYFGLLAIFVFLLFALNSNSVFNFKPLKFRSKILINIEVNVAIKLVVLSSLVLSIIYFQKYYSVDNILTTILKNFFICLSFLTTTGWHFETNFQLDTHHFSLVLIGLVLIGGGIGTTAGGLKLLRFVILLRHLRSEFSKMVYPSVIRASESRMKLNDSIILKVWVFFSTFIFFVLVSICCLSLFGMSMMDAIILSVAAFSNTGPLYEVIIQSSSFYEEISFPIKYVLILGMVLGRVEILVLFALFNTELWQK
jgi:trk system potassium uptake protein TrkH